MLVDFEKMPENARIWVYQANRTIKKEESESIKSQLQVFIENWESHQRPLCASFQLLYDRFIVLAVDESHHPASGCSIDSSVQLMKDIESYFRLNLFDRTQLIFSINDHLQAFSLKSIKDLIHDNVILPDTIVYNNAVTTLKEFRENWAVKVQNSWLAKFLKSSTVQT